MVRYGRQMSERWSTAEVALTGPEFRWSLGLQQYEFPGEGSGDDGNWIEAEVDLVIEDEGIGRFSARRSTTVLTTDLARFAEELQTFLASGVGSAELGMTEEETGFTIRAVEGREHDFDVEIFVQCHTGPELRARELVTAKRNLNELAHTLREAQRAFPIRGNPTD